MPAVLPLTTASGTPLINAAHKGKGQSPNFATVAELSAAVTPGQTGYSADNWLSGQRATVAGEPFCAERVWNGTDMLTVLVAGAIRFRINALTNTVSATTGTPTGGADGDLKIDEATGLVYKKASGAWGAGQFGFAVGAGSGGGSGPVTTQLRFTNLTNGPVAEVGSAAPYTYNGADVGITANYANTAQASVPANTDFTYLVTVRQPNGGNQVQAFLAATANEGPATSLISIDGGGGGTVRAYSGTTLLSSLGTVATPDILRIRRTNSASATAANYIYDVSHDGGTTYVTPFTLTSQNAPALFTGVAFNGTAGCTGPTLIVG